MTPSNSDEQGRHGKDSLLYRPLDLLLYENAIWIKKYRAMYQRLVHSIFSNQIRRNIEVYVDDMVIKSPDKEIMLRNVEETFNMLEKVKMKLNPAKCTFGVEE